LTDVTQTTPNVPGGAIGKSLGQQIGAGQGDIIESRINNGYPFKNPLC